MIKRIFFFIDISPIAQLIDSEISITHQTLIVKHIIDFSFLSKQPNEIPKTTTETNRARSRTLQKPPPPQPTKTSPKSTRAKQSESNLRHVRAGALGGSSGRLREVWREKRRFCKAKSADSGFAALNSPPKGGPFSLQGLPLPSHQPNQHRDHFLHGLYGDKLVNAVEVRTTRAEIRTGQAHKGKPSTVRAAADRD